MILKETWINTPLGPMLTIADDKHLHLLEFTGRKGLHKEIERLFRQGFTIIPGQTPAIDSITRELEAYFDGSLTDFKTPYYTYGSSFQNQVWQSLCAIPYGETKSYKEQAVSLKKPTAYRAVANANGTNQLAIIIPCHRVIASNGRLGGYGGGLPLKQWLLEHEQRYKR